MPIYPYVCTACGHEFDALQKISEDPLNDCPECGESGLRKRLAAPAFQLKGSGWYETDFKNSGKGKKDDKKSDGQDGGKDGESSNKDKGGDTSGESQSESKAGSKAGSKGSSSGDAKPAAAAGGKDD